jgi:NAD-dependent deacetylase sirtuin 2
MQNTPPPPAFSPAAPAAASATVSDATIAECFQAVETLTTMFGFDHSVANQAVDAVGTDITTCYNYILDQALAKDGGGSVYPIDNCPHITQHVQLTLSSLPIIFQETRMMRLPCCISPIHNTATTTATTTSAPTTTNKNNKKGGLKGEVASDGTKCPLGENWLCLACQNIYCSRYINGHCVQHWKDCGHCIGVSLADLSVWCHECQSYIKDKERIQPLLAKLEEIKFDDSHETNHVSHETNAEDQEDYSLEYTTQVNDDNTAATNAATTDATTDATTTFTTTTGDIRKSARQQNEWEHQRMRPPKKQRSIASSLGSDHTVSSESTNNSVPSSNDEAEKDDDSFDEDAKIRAFPISLEEEEEEEDEDEQSPPPMDYPFELLPQSLEEVAKFIQSKNCQNIVILAGAGMSVVSGIPDFRSANGLYATMNADLLTATQSEKDLIRYDPSIALDNRLFLQNQLPCLEVNRQFLLGTRDQMWKATLAHRFVELLHKNTNKLVRLYTQNIDGLEDQCSHLPREKVVPVHGTMDQADCGMCRNEADFEQFCRDVRRNIKDITGTDPTAPTESKHIPCHICGYNTLKPSIVLFKSNLPQRFFELLPRDVEEADLLLVIGTSLKVAPANSIVYRVPKTCLRVLVNRDPVGIPLGMQYGPYAERDYFAEGDIDATMLELMTHLGWLNELEPLLEQGQLPESSADLLQQRLEMDRNKIPTTSFVNGVNSAAAGDPNI